MKILRNIYKMFKFLKKAVLLQEEVHPLVQEFPVLSQIDQILLVRQ